MAADSDSDGIRRRLSERRALTVDRIDALSREFDGVVDASADVATDDEHDPEGATIAFERARVAALLDQARGQLLDVDAALRQVQRGDYGVCTSCGQPIPVARLEALPATRTCVNCASGRRR